MSKSIITRRHLLSTVALGAAAVGLSACAGQSVPDIVKQVASDISLEGTGLGGIVPDLSKLVDSGTLSQVTDWLGKITSAATQVAGLPSTSAAVPVVQQVEQAVNAIVGIAAPLLSATPAGPILAAASALLPVIEAAVGILVPPAARAMSADEARLILRAASR